MSFTVAEIKKLKDIYDIRMVIHDLNLPEPNPALFIKRIIDEEDRDTYDALIAQDPISKAYVLEQDAISAQNDQDRNNPQILMGQINSAQSVDDLKPILRKLVRLMR